MNIKNYYKKIKKLQEEKNQLIIKNKKYHKMMDKYFRKQIIFLKIFNKNIFLPLSLKKL